MTVRSPLRALAVLTATLLTVSLTIAAALLSAPAAADPAPTPIRISGTGSTGAVNIRSASNTGSSVLGKIPEGATPYYHCFEYGETIDGVPIWFNITYNDVTGLYASAFDDASYQSDAELTEKYGVPRCDAIGGPPYNIVPQETEPISVFFSPISGEPHGYGSGQIATVDLKREEWVSDTQCDTSKVVAGSSPRTWCFAANA